MTVGRSKLLDKLRATLLGCVISLLALGALFVVSEAGFRIARAMHNRSMASRISESWFVYDEDLLYRPRYLPSAGPKNGRFRVVVLGDSLIGGSKQNSMVGRLETVVDRGSALPSVEFINTGMPGYTNYQELVYLKKYGLALQPDLVGVVFCLNDVHKFEHSLRVVNGQLLPNTFWDVAPEAGNATKGWALRLARRSLFLRWLRDRTSLAGHALQMYESSGYDFDYRPDFSTAWRDSDWAMIKAQMTEMADLAKAHRFGLFLAVVPFAEQYRQDYLARDMQYVLKPQRILASIMASLDIPYLDLYRYLDNGCFLSDRIHLTEEGKQRAAEHIAEFLRTEKLLPVK